MELYNKIERLCTMMGITRKKMCEDIGLSYNTYNSMLKRQSTGMSLDTLQSIADYFGVTIDYLIRDELTEISSFEFDDSFSSDDEGLRIIERARQKMTARDKERMIRILKEAFEKEFGGNDGD